MSIRERGPLTVAAFMDLALYDPDARLLRPRRPTIRPRGRFFYQRRRRPAVRRAARSPARRDGRLLQIQISEPVPAAFDLVEAGAGNGRLSADILRARAGASSRSSTRDPAASGRSERRGARRASRARSATSPIGWLRPSAALPDSFEGVLVANELLDAMPVHQVVMREDGLREVYVDADAGRRTG